MANGSPTPGNNWDQVREIIGVQGERLRNLEESFGRITDQIGALSKKLDAKPTNWLNFFGTGAAILGVVGAFFWQDKVPTNAILERHDREIGKLYDDSISKPDFTAYETRVQTRILANEASTDKVGESVVGVEKEIAAIRSDLSGWTSRVADYHEDEQKSLTRVENHVNEVDAQLIRRPEIESKFNSISASVDAKVGAVSDTTSRLSMRLTDIQHEYGSNYTLGDALKALQQKVDALQLQKNLPAPPASRPAD